MGSVSELPAFKADGAARRPADAGSILIAPAGAVDSGELS